MPPRLGQHFLADASIARRIADAVGRQPLVLEIGGGTGALTRRLVPLASRLVVIELDRNLAARLASDAAPPLEVIQGDVRELRLSDLGGGPWAVAGNIPYALTSEIVVWLCEQWREVTQAVLMVQAEVAERLAAPPGRKAYGRLSVLVQYRAVVERLLDVPAAAFRPPPKVDSTVVRLTFREPPVAVADEARFFALVEHGFRWRRKALRSVLRQWRGWTAAQAEAALAAAGIDPQRRAETLDLAEFAALAAALGAVT